jgi:hypothetical protein
MDLQIIRLVLQDLLTILPMLDSLVLLDVSGQMIHQVSLSSTNVSYLSFVIHLRQRALAYLFCGRI